MNNKTYAVYRSDPSNEDKPIGDKMFEGTRQQCEFVMKKCYLQKQVPYGIWECTVEMNCVGGIGWNNEDDE